MKICVGIQFYSILLQPNERWEIMRDIGMKGQPKYLLKPGMQILTATN